jgi:gamma-glutamyltranspeptidase/glutathione hydrolase
MKGAASVALFVFCTAVWSQSRFMVAAAHPLAVEAGVSVLKLGGSAVDAAVAVQAMLGLVEPESSGIGGGAFMLHWSAKEKKLRSYDGRETAPAAAQPDRFLKNNLTAMEFSDAAVGGLSVGVPGVLRMLELAHRRHGRLHWAENFPHAIFAAEEGFPMSPRLHGQLAREPFLKQDAFANGLYYTPQGAPKAVGERIVNKTYGETLRLVAQQGADVFYRGAIAADIVRAVRTHAKPGDLTEEDLAAYRPVEREPLCGPYREWQVCSMAPPSSGGIAVLQILGILERVPFARAAPHSADALHYFAEAGRLAYADRARYVGDPDFVSVPMNKLLDKGYLDERARLIGERSMRTAGPGDTEAPGTSHFTIVDAEGDIVSMTTTIEATFGSRVMVRGFLLNNELTDFDFKPGGPNQVAPRKRPRSSMAPTLVFENSLPKAALGSPGGPFIINYVAKTLVGLLDWKLDIQSAIRLPNSGSRNGPTEIELGSAYEPLAAVLAERGHPVAIREMPSGLHGIERWGGGWRGGADPRREGIASGP